MESLQEKNLTLDEKAKLKERLALLKKEYKRTVNRLQRSQRAERVKSHVKKTIEEQNRLLSQECAITGSALVSTGLVTYTINASGDVGESQESVSTLVVDKDRKPCVTFNLEPEVHHADSRSPACSGGESSGREAEAASRAEGNGTHIPKQRTRSRLSLSRSLKRVCRSASPSLNVIQQDRIINVPEGQQVNTVAESPSESPVFKRCLKENVTVEEDATISFCSERLKAADLSPEIGGSPGVRTSLVNATDRSPCDRMHNDDTTTEEPTHSNIDNISNRLGTKEEQPLCVTKFPVVRAHDRTCNATETASISQNNPLLRSENQTLTNAEDHGERSLTVEERNPLNSCTLVEGLLFPVEYYVRTTRRMTSCQRKVDLDAVINSHLGLARKGTRGRQWQRSTSLSPRLKDDGNPSTLNHSTVNTSAGEVTRSKRGKGRKSCPAVMFSSGLKDISVQLEFGSDASLMLSGFQSEKENREEKAPSKKPNNEENCLTNITEHSQVKEVLKTRESLVSLPSERKVYSLRPRDAGSHCLHTLTNDSEDFESNPYILRTSKDTKELADSPFPFSGRVTLEHVSRHLDITDFHLPDEEFGVLKLEKLKSTSHLESFVPTPTRARKNPRRAHRNDRATLEAAGSSAVQHGTLRVCPSASEHDLRLLSLHGDCLNDGQSVDSQENISDNNTTLVNEASNLGLVVSQVCPSSDPINALRISPVICGPMESKGETCYFPSSFIKRPFPLDQSLEEVSLETPSSSAEEEKLLSKIIDQSPVRALDHAERKVLVLNTDVLEKLAQPESVGDNLLVSRTDMESIVVTNCPTETNTPTNLSSPKSLACNVLFSTSVCSVSLGGMNESEVPDNSSQFPFLGPTPAVFSSPQACNTPNNAYREQTILKTEGLLPETYGKDGLEYTSVNSEERIVALVETDANHCSRALPLSGDVSVVCDYTMEDKQRNNVEPCGKKGLQEVTTEDKADGEIQENANRLDSDNVEEGTLRSEQLRLISVIQDSCGGGCAVDLCSVWWEFSGCTDLCILSASESSVCLWRPQAAGKWKCAHTWSFTEMPVIQILPLSQEKNIVCVALGNLDIMEIWVLFSHPESQSWEKQLVKCGHTKTAQGLSRHRVVSSSGVGDGQVVELCQLSEGGSTLWSLALTAPTDSILAFSEVDGERDALVGSTVDNNLVIWNCVTGHLLSTIYIGDLCSDVVCLSAASDSGLLFLVVGSLFDKHGEAAGSCIFQLIAANVRGGASALVMSYTIPERLKSRYLEGDVKNQRAAAVLTCGRIALWDLPRSHCSSMLPLSSDTPWCLVRWGHRPSCLLTGQKDGTIFVYEYTDHSSNKTRNDLGEVV
ncbi:partner and localizer of BRCA2 [Mixophyes fleayi]|uniref:partner and localizer of BRCA2 n=1 Tax=Mixophyes fleayi TaxID=3061075 RepID=UPI003F4E3F78